MSIKIDLIIINAIHLYKLYIIGQIKRVLYISFSKYGIYFIKFVYINIVKLFLVTRFDGFQYWVMFLDYYI